MANEKRLIYANALKDLFCNACSTKNRYKRTVEECRSNTDTSGNICFKMRLIDAAPTVDAVEVVHGRWIEDVATDMIACTECGHAWNIIDNCTETFNYCPNCGARMMDGGNEDV